MNSIEEKTLPVIPYNTKLYSGSSPEFCMCHITLQHVLSACPLLWMYSSPHYFTSDVCEYTSAPLIVWCVTPDAKWVWQLIAKTQFYNFSTVVREPHNIARTIKEASVSGSMIYPSTATLWSFRCPTYGMRFCSTTQTFNLIDPSTTPHAHCIWPTPPDGGKSGWGSQFVSTPEKFG